MNDPTIQRPDVQKVLSRLKPFQRDTAEYVFRRFYLDSDATNRFLVADEAGLGKTMVAKGVLAKAIDYLWDSVKRIDVVYICSNADIARQNINRLNLSGHGDNEFASRITLLPVRMKKLNEKLNFISFTPGTSFDLKSSMGIAEERRLIYWMLKDSWGFLGTGLLNVMQGGIRKHTTWRKYVEQFDVADIDPIICKEFINNLNTYIADEKAGKVDSVKERFEALCARFYRGNMRFEGGNVSERNHLIGIVRGILAKTCLKRLEPDIVILDEFQRFKNLLSDEDEAGQLAQELFNYADEHSKVRILLLSATPYKMYTQYDDQDDDHYKDFLKTVEFLEKGKPVGIEDLLKEFRQELFRYHDGDFNKLVDIKSRLEERLRKVIARKERIAGSIIHDDMLKDKSAERLPVLTTKDIQHYLALQKIAGCLDHGDMIEYWKSASYLLNFMDGYKIKERLHCAITEGRTEDLTAIINREPGVVLPWQEVERYGEVAPANPRLQQLFDDIIDNGAWQLLWMPPSLPYYSSEKGPYAKFSDQQLTKRLVFSSWNVVPKLIAAMVSYEAERRMFGLFENNPEYSPAWRKKQGTLLKFAVSERLSGMPVLGILYPCFTLACCCDPLRLYSENLKSTNAVPSLDAVKHVIASKIQRLLDNLIIQDNASATTDENWYWAAPILLDLQQDRAATVDWLNQQRLDLLWCGVDGAGGDDKESNWSDHVGKAKEILDGTVSLGRRPDDLVQVLTLMALGGPAVVALRAVCRMAEDDSFHTNVDYRNAAASIAWGFRSFFNRPEVTCLLRGLNPGVVYWQRVLEYSTEGGLQGVRHGNWE